MIVRCIIRNPWLILTIALGTAIIGCKDFEDCRTAYTSLVAVDFQKTADFKAIETLGGVTYSQVPKGSVLLLPLDPSADSTTFCFHSATPGARVDTLTIFYKRMLSLISPQCSVQQEYILDSLQTTFAGGTKIITYKLLRDKKGKADVQISY